MSERGPDTRAGQDSRGESRGPANGGAAKEPLYEVAIVGTGPSGLTLANILGHHGIRTLVLERDAELSPLPKALNIDDEFFRLLANLGIGDALAAQAKFPISYNYVSPLGQRLGYVEGRLTEHNFPNRAAIFQPDFEQLLYRGALASGSVSVRFSEEVIGIAERGDAVEIDVQGCNGARARHHARFVVGADGAHSVCRKQLGLPLEQIDPFDVRHVVIDVRDDIDASALALTKMGWRRNFFSMPAPNGRRFEFSLRPDETAETMLDDDVLRRLFKPWRNYDEMHIIRKVVHSFRSRLVPRLRVGNVFLIGDAAHLMPVFGSQGMNSGARDANNLGWKLVQVLRHGAPAMLLDTYHDERWAAVRQTIRMSTLNGKLQKVQPIALSLLRDLFFAALKLSPSATRYIREMRYVPKPYLRSAGVRAKAGRARAHDIVGRLLPNPTVRGAGGEQRLDAVLGLAFVLVGIDADRGALARVTAAARAITDRVVIVRPGRSADAASGANPDADLDADLHVDAGFDVDATPTDVRPRRAPAGVVRIVRVADTRFDPLFRDYRGQWLLVRPDRVVACAGAAAQLGTDLDALARLFAGARRASTSASPDPAVPSVPTPAPAARLGIGPIA